MVPDDVVLALRDAVSRSAVDDFWSIWSSNAEAGLFRAYLLLGRVLLLLAVLVFLEEVCYVFVAGVWEAELMVVKLLAGCIGLSRGDDVDAHCARFLTTPLFLLCLLFRRRHKSVADVLKGIRSKGFTQSRWDAVLRYWSAVCRHGPCGPISFFSSLGCIGFLLISIAFTNGFLIPLSC